MTESPPAQPAGPVTSTTRDLAKTAVSGRLGTAMEFMDFQLIATRPAPETHGRDLMRLEDAG